MSPPLSPEAYELVKEDIRGRGIASELIVSKREDDSLVIISGHHRHKAALEIGLEEVPCKVHVYESITEEEADIIRLNAVQRTVNKWQQMVWAFRLMDMDDDLREREKNPDGSFKDPNCDSAQKGSLRERILKQVSNVNEHDYSFLHFVKGLASVEEQEDALEYLLKNKPTRQEMKDYKAQRRKDKKTIKDLQERVKSLEKDNSQYKAGKVLAENLDVNSNIVNELEKTMQEVRANITETTTKILMSKARHSEWHKAFEYKSLMVMREELFGQFKALYLVAEQAMYPSMEGVSILPEDVDRRIRDLGVAEDEDEDADTKQRDIFDEGAE